MNLKILSQKLKLLGFICFGFSWKINAQTKPMEVFVLMGQSNMAGFAELMPEDRKIVKNVFKIPAISTLDLAWEPATHPLHNRLKTDKFGLGLPFALEYLKHKKTFQ